MIPRLLTMNPSSFLEGTPKTLGWVEFPAKFSEAVQGLFQVSNELILSLSFDDNIIDISFNIAM